MWQRLSFGSAVCILLLGCEAHKDAAVESPNQHFTLQMEVNVNRVSDDAVTGSFIGHMVFDEEMRLRAHEALKTATDLEDRELLDAIVTGSKVEPLTGISVVSGDERTETLSDGSFSLPINGSASSLDVVRYDFATEHEITVFTMELPRKTEVSQQMIPVKFNHEHGSGHTMKSLQSQDWRCRKCNGWWNWDQGRSGSDCFRALARGFVNCWLEGMNADAIFKGRFCNGSTNCSVILGHSPVDFHTHGASRYDACY